MLKKILPLFIFALSACQAAPVLQAQIPPAALMAQRATQSAIFPVQQGYRWEYDVTLAPVMDPYAEEHGSYSMEIEKINQTPAGDELLFRAQSGFNNRYSFPSIVQSASGIRLQDMTFLGIGSDEARGLSINFLEQPLQAGKSWKDENWIGKVKGQEQVTVPAGTFNAWRIEVIGTHGYAYTAVGDYWFAPGHGIVKSSLTVPDWHVESVLRSEGPKR